MKPSDLLLRAGAAISIVCAQMWSLGGAVVPYFMIKWSLNSIIIDFAFILNLRLQLCKKWRETYFNSLGPRGFTIHFRCEQTVYVL